MRRMYSENQLVNVIEEKDVNFNKNVSFNSIGIIEKNASNIFSYIGDNVSVKRVYLCQIGQFIYIDFTLDFTDTVTGTLLTLKSQYTPKHVHYDIGSGAGNTATRVEIATTGNIGASASQNTSTQLHMSTIYALDDIL